MKKISTETGKNIVISMKKSEADIQYRLVKRIECLKIKWLQIMQECSITISHIESKKYYKIDRATRNLYKIDVLLKKWDDIMFIEVKKEKTKSIRKRSSITAQVNKYRDLWYICLLCEGINDIKDVIPEVEKFFNKPKNKERPKIRKKI